MREVWPRLYVGNDADYERVKDNEGWAFVRACKEGPGGHRDTLGYTTHGAPTGSDYYYVEKENKLALNLIDPPTAKLIPAEVIDKAVAYAREKLGEGKKVLIACNGGVSRAPTIAMLLLHSMGVIPASRAVLTFRKWYPLYAPNKGMKEFSARSLKG